MHICTINNHTIKYESQSLVVGEAIVYKRILKPVSPCKNWNLFADLRYLFDVVLEAFLVARYFTLDTK